MQMSGKGTVKNSNKMGALVSSMLEISQNLAKYECIIAPLHTLVLLHHTRNSKGVRLTLFPQNSGGTRDKYQVASALTIE